MKITRTQLIQIIMEELNEESGDEVRDTLGLCDRYGVGPNDRLVTDKTFGIGVFISQLKKLWIEENRAGMMEHLKDFFDDHNVIADLDWLDCVEWSDTQRAAYAELKEHLIDLGERYRAVHRVLQYTASREHGIQTPEQLDAEKIEDVYAWDHYDDVARLLNQLKWVTTVDVESEPEEPEPFRERKITPTQFKELLLEEVGNCTEPQHVIFSIVRDMDPNDVAELFQDVFEQLPGVEMTRLDPEDEEPIPTSYQPGGELGDRPVVGFKEQLMEMVRQELSEGCENVLAAVIGTSASRILEKGLRVRLEGLVEMAIGWIPFSGEVTGFLKLGPGIKVEQEIGDLVFNQVNKLVVEQVSEFEAAQNANEAAYLIIGQEKYETICQLQKSGESVEAMQAVISDVSSIDLVAGIIWAAQAGYLTDTAKEKIEQFNNMTLGSILPDSMKEWLKKQIEEGGAGEDAGWFKKLMTKGAQVAYEGILEMKVGEKILSFFTGGEGAPPQLMLHR